MIHRAGRSLAALVVAGCLAGLASADDADPPALGLIVKLRDASAPAERWQRVMRDSATPAKEGRRIGLHARRLDFDAPMPGRQAARLAERLRAHPDVAWAEPDVREPRLDVPASEPLFGQQWWLQTVAGTNANAIEDRRRGVSNFASAWNVTPGSAAAIVALLDTGTTPHPDLAGRFLPGYDFISSPEAAADGDGRDADPSDPGDGVTENDRAANPTFFGGCALESSSWHGTRIAGMIAAVSNNGEGVAGMNRAGRILPVRVGGRCGALVSDIVDAMRWAAGLNVPGVPANPNPARIINISFGGSAACSPVYQDAIDEVRAAGAIVVASAGNRGSQVSRPASCERVLGVAALNRDGFKATYSSFGARVALAAVGGDPPELGAWGTLLGDDGLLTLDNTGLQAPGDSIYGGAYGTSFSAPVVSGVASLMLSVNPSLTAAQLFDGLLRSARPHVTSPKLPACSTQSPGRCLCTPTTCGAGIVDAAQAVAYAASPGSYVAPAWPAVVIDNAQIDAAIALGPDQPAEVSVPASGGEGGGGGALGLGWLAALGAATALLSRWSPPSGRRGSRRAARRP